MNDKERRRLLLAYRADARKFGFSESDAPAMVAETERLEALSTLRRVDPAAWAAAVRA